MCRTSRLVYLSAAVLAAVCVQVNGQMRRSNKDWVLDTFDILAFQNLFVLDNALAGCDQSTGVGVLDL